MCNTLGSYIVKFYSNFAPKLSTVDANWTWAVWPDLAKFRHFGKILRVFGNFVTIQLLFCIILSY